MRERALATAAGALFVVLAWSASAGPHLFDAGELVAAGAELGGSHPPGQPLHALVAYAATLVPLGPIAWRIACASVLFGVLGALSGARIVRDAGGSPAAAVAALIAITALPAVAPQIGRPEVYTLALFLTLEGARHLLAWARGAARGLRIGALTAGLALAVHPPHALALLAIGAGLLLASRRDVRPRALGSAATACAIGALVIAYLPVRGAAGAPTWGDPTSARGLLDYLSASAYRRNLGAEDGTLLGNVLEVIAYVALPAGLAALPALAWIGRPGDRRAIRAIAIAAGAAIVAACLQRLEPANPDNVAYAGAASALFVALGLAATAAIADPRAAGAAAAAIAAAVIVLGDAAALRADLPQLETLSFALLDAPPPRALVIARTDATAAAWMEARAVEGARPDAALLVEGLATSSWHWRSLRTHPAMGGAPVRAGPGVGSAPWVLGAIARARGAIPVAAEGDGPFAGRGEVIGAYLVVGAAARRAAFAERTAGAPARMIPFTPAGHGGAAHGVVREVEIARARRLFARGEIDRALGGLARAAAPLPPDALAPALGSRSGPPVRPPPAWVDDPTSIYATAEDAVRALACALVSIDRIDDAIELLARQDARGDDRAALELAAVHASLGRPDLAASVLARYRALHPEREREIAALGLAPAP